MYFFGKNLKPKHKVTLCLAMLAILGNVFVCSKKLATFPFYIERLTTGEIAIHTTQIIMAFDIFVKILMIAFFRKF